MMGRPQGWYSSRAGACQVTAEALEGLSQHCSPSPRARNEDTVAQQGRGQMLGKDTDELLLHITDRDSVTLGHTCTLCAAEPFVGLWRSPLPPGPQESGQSCNAPLGWLLRVLPELGFRGKAYLTLIFYKLDTWDACSSRKEPWMWGQGLLNSALGLGLQGLRPITSCYGQFVCGSLNLQYPECN
jgi:hypothetical protein